MAGHSRIHHLASRVVHLLRLVERFVRVSADSQPQEVVNIETLRVEFCTLAPPAAQSDVTLLQK